MYLLSEQEISTRLKSLPKWTKKSAAISRTFEFKDFLQGIDFVNRVAKVAETNNHHPDIEIHWNKVTLVFTTHDEGGLTEKDFELANECEKIFADF